LKVLEREGNSFSEKKLAIFHRSNQLKKESEKKQFFPSKNVSMQTVPLKKKV